LFGGLLLASVDTEGKPSVGWRARRAARRVRRAAPGVRSKSADGLSEGLHRTAEHGRDLAAAAGEKGQRLIEVTRKEAPVVAEAAMERGKELAEFAREHGGELAEGTKTAAADLRAQARS